jgi:hypothetical protein
VARAVDVRVVAVLGRVLEVGRRDRDAALALLGRLVDGAVLEEAREALLGLALGDGGRQRRLAVVDVADGACRAVRSEGTRGSCVPMLTCGLSRLKASVAYFLYRTADLPLRAKATGLFGVEFRWRA